ncbi:hypothetical protein V9L05_08760 [Bernardetia sp. Wsw4-3y2]|uniref:hypothetical protein n=1 Tax=Bernardetia sp. Wsw4-3y2 TaxID=3127471 RepID=UPI0030CF480B
MQKTKIEVPQIVRKYLGQDLIDFLTNYIIISLKEREYTVRSIKIVIIDISNLVFEVVIFAAKKCHVEEMLYRKNGSFLDIKLKSVRSADDLLIGQLTTQISKGRLENLYFDYIKFPPFKKYFKTPTKKYYK